ncbi:hypothetical protein [Streptomyces sp. NPDC008125]|uniref:effector-associated constant component EACC1 n=1 Tax=Streptomyces sp. NPDC008125 TaxID=3364811 RepID=UPI0036EA790B
MRISLVCVDGSESLSSLRDAVNRQVGRPDFAAEITKKPGARGDMGVLDEGIAFASQHPQVIEQALTAFLIWLEARLGRTSTWTVTDGRRTVQVEATKLDRRAREAIAELLKEAAEEETDRPGS